MEDSFGCFSFSKGFIGEANSMEADVFRKGENIFRYGIVTTLNESASTRGLKKRNAGTRRAAHFKVGVIPGTFHDIYDVFQQDFADMNIVGRFHGVDEILRRADSIVGDEVEFGSSDSAFPLLFNAKFEVSTKDFFFFLGFGVAESVAEHEAVKLSFGKFESS